MGSNGFTKTEKSILELLSDGQGHDLGELRKLLPDELGDRVNVRVHIYNIRKKLEPEGETILCEMRWRKGFYRHVRLLHSSHDGKR